jgi:hypothetical protein
VRYNELLRGFRAEVSKLKYEINNIEDANWAYENLLEGVDESNPNKKMFKGKLKQLENLTTKIGSNNSNYIASIEPGSFYSRTYVLRFYRRAISTKVYNISFDSIYIDETTNQEFRANVSTAVNITPKPLFLTIFAALMSILGTTLKYCMNNSDKEYPSLFDFFHQLGKIIITSPGITSIIIAILVFNIYEFTEFGKKIKMGINWRAALTIGILAGIFGDRLVEAIKVFIGIN